MTNNITPSDSRITRRAILSSVSTGIVAVTGCTGNSDPENGNSSQTDSGLNLGDNDVFTAIEMEGTDLEVTLTDDASVGHVDLINPDEEVESREMVQDDVQIVFTLLGEAKDGFSPGEYQLVAVHDDDLVAETTISLEPNLEITDVLWAANNPDMDWDTDSSTWDEHAAVLIENSGTAPSYLTEIQWIDAPITRLDRIGSDDTESHFHDTLLPPGETTIYSAGPVYRTEGRMGYGRRVECNNLETEPMTVTAVVQTGENPSYTQSIEYGGTNTSCELAIVDGNSHRGDT